MKRILLSLVVFFFLSYHTATGQTPRLVTLKDGSQIRGTLLSVSDNIFVLETAFGEVQINGDDIIRMTSEDSPAAPSPKNILSNQDMLRYQQQIISDPEMMRDLENLAQDESILQMLTDPKLMNALMSGDLDQIQNNPEFQEILKNPLIRKMMQKVGQQLDL